MIIQLNTILIFVPLCLAWQNNWDGPLDVTCNVYESFYRIRSEHDNGKEDRRWQFDCHSLGYPLGACDWHNDVNDWDGPVDFNCPNNGAITGVKSHHDNGKEDRKWSFRCCNMREHSGREVVTSGFVNDWDKSMDYTVPSNHYLTGSYSYHDNGKEDRRFKFKYCMLWGCDSRGLCVCVPIDYCDHETCTVKDDNQCAKCEGTIQPKAGYRAYYPSSDKKTCIQACSWRKESSRCFPGNCNSESRTSCKCSDGFSAKHCSKIDKEPTILFNQIELIADNGDVKEVPQDINSARSQPVSWTNIVNPKTLRYVFRSHFEQPNPQPRPAYISDYKIGITSGYISFTRKSRSGSTVFRIDGQCPDNGNFNPNQAIYDCSNSLDRSKINLPFNHLDSLDIDIDTSNGGFVQVLDMEEGIHEKFTYAGSSSTVTFTVKFDTVKPTHCKPSGCNSEILTDLDLTKTNKNRISWSGWTDDSSGLEGYEIEIFSLRAAGNLLVTNKREFDVTKPSSTSSLEINFPQPDVYAIILLARDNAGNQQATRRIVIYDNVSVVEKTTNSVFRVTTATPETQYKWQHNLKSLTIEWQDRYINKRHTTGKYLAAVEDYHGLATGYDDKDGKRRNTAIDNVQGIVKFESYFDVDQTGGTTILSRITSDGKLEIPYKNTGNLDQKDVLSPTLKDGDTIKFFLKASDIFSRYVEDSLTVHFDSTPPIIQNLWLTKGDELQLAVHNFKDFNKLVIEWELYDKHSGIESVEWRLYDNYDAQTVLHGSEHIQAQGDTGTMTDCTGKYKDKPRGSKCYCTPVNGCYHQHFQVKPRISTNQGEGLIQSKSQGNHDHDYFIEVTAMNHAKLTSKLTYKITIDTSPPHKGSVHDGKFGQPEVDYQSGLEIHGHWEGFFDRESGIKHYQYGYSTKCLKDSDFNIDISKTTGITMTQSRNVKWTAPKAGKYYLTVIAYNAALDPSAPVCSDGITIDSSRASITDVFIEGAKIEAGLVSFGGDIYHINHDRKIHKITSPSAVCQSKATLVSDISLFPVNKFPNQTIQNQDLCKASGLDVKFATTSYLTQHTHMYVNWTGTDKESGIYDYQFGLSSTKSSASSPDLHPFVSTNHHPWYNGYHPQLTDGTEFYIVIKATNKAGMETIKTVGPVLVFTSPPILTGKITITLKNKELVADWTGSTITDNDDSRLKFTAAIGTTSGGQDVHHFSSLRTSKNCQKSSPPTCTVFLVDELNWKLNHKYDYYISIRVENIAGLYTTLTSSKYTHYSRLPARGIVFDVMQQNELSLFGASALDEGDFQLSTKVYNVRWYGFESGRFSDDISYRVVLKSDQDAELASQVVGKDTQYTFSGLNLQTHKRYYVTVTATNEAGSTSVSSDGVYILNTNFNLKDEVQVNDGIRCSNNSASEIWNPNHHLKKSGDPVCKNDINYQTSSTSYSFNWVISDKFQHIYPHVKWVLQVKQDDTDYWFDIKNDKFASTAGQITQLISLNPCKQYRSQLVFCAGTICSQPVNSDGVVVLFESEKPKISLQHTNDTIDIVLSYSSKFNQFHVCHVNNIIDKLEWSLTSSQHHSSLYLPWTPVTHVIDETKKTIKASIKLPGRLDFSKCRKLAVRIYNKAGISTIVSSEIKDCSTIDPIQIIPAIVIDAVGPPLESNINTNTKGSSISLDQNGQWLTADADYTPYNNIISAVWPKLRHRNYSWGLFEDLAISSYLTRENIVIKDPCSHPEVLKCGETNIEFINIIPDTALIHGKRYHVCIHADAKSVKHEKWTENMEEINSCSNGVTVDLSPPSGGRVWIETGTNSQYQISSNSMKVLWDSFVDVEEETAAHHSGISHYIVRIGSFVGGADVLQKENVGLVNHKTFYNLELQNSHPYYVTVEAVDFVSRSKEISSRGINIDNTPPEITGYFPSSLSSTDTVVSICWTDSFKDIESGLKGYKWCVGSRPGFQDIVPCLDTTRDCGEVNMNGKLKDGLTFYISVHGINGAGISSRSNSRPILLDTSPPTAGVVNDVSGDSNEDVDYVTKLPYQPSVHWQGFHDPHSTIKHYSVKLGTCPGCDDIVTESIVQTSEKFTFKSAALIHGEKYYSTVTACNIKNLCTSVSSDGFIIDVTPPIVGEVFDGTNDADIDFQSLRNFVGAKWIGFEDTESGIVKYIWKVGTVAGGNDIYLSETLPSVEIIYTTKLDPLLPVGRKIYSTIIAYNKAGLHTASYSDGFIVDTTPPVVSKNPVLSSTFASILPSSTISTTNLKIEWSFKDVESDIERQYLSLSPHLLGDFSSSLMEIPSVLNEYIYSGLKLHDGSKYKVKVIGCNLAGMCQSAVTDDILVDSTPPSRGAFAIKTDHAANIYRHDKRWLEWNTTHVKISWLGFTDLHTPITHYLISVGSKPFFTDYNKGDKPSKIDHTQDIEPLVEGSLQTTTIETSKNLQHGTSLFVAIWAVNKVGLKSLPIHSEFKIVHADFQTNTKGSLVRRCVSYNCEGHCVCSEQDKTCSVASGCTKLNQGNPNTIIDVIDRVNLHKDDSLQTSYTPANTFLSARWKIKTQQGLTPLRYEISVGLSSNDQPTGVLDTTTDRHWFDVGKSLEATITLDKDHVLHDTLSYSMFVRVWYDDKQYAVFKSPGIVVILTPPAIRNVLGSAVKEVKSITSDKDIDSQTSTDTVIINWTNKFNGGIHKLKYFKPYLSTHPQGHNLHKSVNNIAPPTTVYTAGGLSLLENKMYYSMLLACGQSELVSWSSSDGITIDNTKPTAGRVHDGLGPHDAEYQTSTREVSASWYGFSDIGTGIVQYYWCVGRNQSICDIQPWTAVGLNVHIKRTVSSPLTQGKTIYHRVKAVDGSGLESSVSVSNGITIDNTPPIPHHIQYSGDNLLLNPSFETMSTTVQNSDCHTSLMNWNFDSESCVQTVVTPDSLSKHGTKYLKLRGQIKQKVSNLNIGQEYHVVVHVGYPNDVKEHDRNVEGFVKFGKEIFKFQLRPYICDKDCTGNKVIYWYQYTYVLKPESTTVELGIGTTSNNMVIAVDDVKLYKINSIPITSNSTKHITHHALFNSDWSSLHLQWYFIDNESPIVEYQWALGTVKGGTQIREFTSQGHHNHVTISGLHVVHNTLLYLTVKAVNNAGLMTVTHSNSILVDMTPPVLLYVNDGLGNDVDYQSNELINVNWKVEDKDSGINYCLWAVGTQPNKGDVQQFIRIAGNKTTASVQLSKIGFNKLYSTVRCYNNGGQHVTGSSNGVFLVTDTSQSLSGQMSILQDPTSQYILNSQCHPNSDQMRIKWSAETDSAIIAAMVGVASVNSKLQKEVKLRDIDYNGAVLKELKLQPKTDYNISISTVNIVGKVEKTLTKKIATNRNPPKIKVGSSVAVANALDSKSVELSWKDIFVSDWNTLKYEVSLGTVQGAGDIIQWQETNSHSITISNQREYRTVYISVTAVDSCGLSTNFSEQVTIM